MLYVNFIEMVNCGLFSTIPLDFFFFFLSLTYQMRLLIWKSRFNLLHSPDLTSSDVTRYTLDSTAGVWPHQVNFTLPGYLFIHLGFPECPRVVLSVTFIPWVSWLWTNDIWLTDDRRLYPSCDFLCMSHIFLFVTNII